MTPDDILSQPQLTLSQRQREFYFENGYLAAQDLIPQDVIETLRTATRDLVDESANLTASNDRFDLSPDHSAQEPRPRRIRAAVDQHPAYWKFASSPLMTDIAADLVGPDVKFHSSKLNFKWPGGDEIKWHQDIPAWPHSNFSPVTIGIYLEDVATADGPLAAIPGSQDRELFDHFGEDGSWTGYIADRDLASVALDSADDMEGPAGTLAIVNCRTIHGSKRNTGNHARPLLLNVYSSADAFALCAPPTPTTHTGEIVRGEPARWSHNDPRPCRIPPDWARQGYVSIFAAQNQESPA